MEYKDYYKILGVGKSATKDELSKAFKKLARKYHPDLNPDNPEAEAKFKEANEAYEVLKDPEKRKMYDTLGPNWQHGQDFQPPPGYENIHFNFGGGGGQGFDAGGFSDFFETIFGGAGGGMGGGQGGFRNFSQGGAGAGFGGQRRPRPRRGADAEATLELTLEEAYRGGSKNITLTERGHGPDGMPTQTNRTLDVNIPAGVKDGQRIRLGGQGDPGSSGGPSGDLFLKVRIAPHHLYKVSDSNVILELPVTPSEAALGASVKVPTLEGLIEMNIPAGTGSGKKMRVRGRGLGCGAKKGDQIVKVMVKAPPTLTDEERKLYEKLAETSTFKPRSW